MAAVETLGPKLEISRFSRTWMDHPTRPRVWQIFSRGTLAAAKELAIYCTLLVNESCWA